MIHNPELCEFKGGYRDGVWYSYNTAENRFCNWCSDKMALTSTSTNSVEQCYFCDGTPVPTATWEFNWLLGDMMTGCDCQDQSCPEDQYCDPNTGNSCIPYTSSGGTMFDDFCLQYPQHPNCAGDDDTPRIACGTNNIGNGECDPDCNTLENDWDGGDCCPSTCMGLYGPGTEPCGVFGYICNNPCSVERHCNCHDCPGVFGENPPNPDLNPCCCNGVSVNNRAECLGDETPTDGVCGGILGDVNGDGNVNIMDIVAIVDIILDELPYNPCGDMNSDGENNIMDVVAVTEWILNGNPTTRSTPNQRRFLINILGELRNIQKRNQPLNRQMKSLQNIKIKLQQIN